MSVREDIDTFSGYSEKRTLSWVRREEEQTGHWVSYIIGLWHCIGIYSRVLHGKIHDMRRSHFILPPPPLLHISHPPSRSCTWLRSQVLLKDWAPCIVPTTVQSEDFQIAIGSRVAFQPARTQRGD